MRPFVVLAVVVVAAAATVISAAETVTFPFTSILVFDCVVYSFKWISGYAAERN